MYTEICSELISVINDATKTVWYFRQQYLFKGYRKLQQVITDISTVIGDLIDVCGQEILQEIGLTSLLDAQEQQDEILIADVLEGQFVPALESVVQQMESQMSVDQFDYLEKNLGVLLGKNQEELVKVISMAKGIDSCKYIPEFTSSGQITIRLYENGEQYYISGNNNPYRDAMQFVRGNLEDDIYQYIIIGAGMLYEAQMILEEKPDVQLVVVEDDPYLFRQVLTYRDVTSILQDKRLTLVCSNLARYIGNIDVENQRLLIRKSALRHIHDMRTKNLLERFFVKYMTIKEQAFVLEKNFRENIVHNENIRSVDEIAERIKGRRVYLVAGGPSLNDTTDVLKERQEGEVILCVGTAASKLKAEGIVPDYVIIVDPSACIQEQIDGSVDADKTELLYMCSASSEALQSFTGTKYAIFQKGFYKAEEYANEHGYTLIATGGSVSTTALDLCIRFGCKEIVCLGLDLAYTGNKSHADGLLETHDTIITEHTPMIKSVNGCMIPTSTSLLCFHQWIENRIRDMEDISIVNVSDGAYIMGMINISVSKYMEKIETG